MLGRNGIASVLKATNSGRPVIQFIPKFPAYNRLKLMQRMPAKGDLGTLKVPAPITYHRQCRLHHIQEKQYFEIVVKETERFSIVCGNLFRKP